MTGANSNKRAAQNSEQIWRCIYNTNTLTKEAKATLFTYATDYVVQEGIQGCQAKPYEEQEEHG
jgi:hypothetical protein